MPIPGEGLVVLYDNVSDSSTAVDIVAVHGLGATPEWAWICKKNLNEGQERDVNWLNDALMLPAQIPNARIMAFGYDSHWFGFYAEDLPRQRLTLISESLLFALASRRLKDKLEDNRPFIFIGHSYGGLVIEHALVTANQTGHEYQVIVVQTAGVVFLGTPHRGSGAQSSGMIVAKAAKVLGFKTEERLIKDLEQDSQTLTDLLHNFVMMIMSVSIPIMCFFEILDTNYSRRLPSFFQFFEAKFKVVDEISGTITGFRKNSLNTDHFKINKFGKPDDVNYIKVSDEIVAMALNASKLIKARLTSIARNQTVDNTELSPHQKNCLRDIFVVDPQHDQKRADQQLQGTLEWVLECPQYTAWLGANSSRLLWVSGKPGSGKTVLSSFLVRELQKIVAESSSASLAFFFCDSKLPSKRTVLSILRTLLWQLLLKKPVLFRHVLPEYEMKKDIFKSVDAVSAIFDRVMKDPEAGPVYIVIDALDECEEGSRPTIYQILKDIIGRTCGDQASRSIRFAVTSRRYDDIRLVFNSLSALEVDFEKSGNAINEDIAKYISYRVTEVAARNNYPEVLKAKIENTLKDRANGMFLYVSLILRDLSSDETRATPKAVEESLNSLPETLYGVYSQILERVPPKSQQFVAKVLRLLVVAIYPLQLNEINFALAIKPEDLSEASIKDEMSYNIEGDISKNCGVIVQISEGTVQLVHQSAKDFLLQLSSSTSHSSYGVDVVHANHILAESCIRYLIFEDFSRNLVAVKDFADKRPIDQHLQRHPFLEYAANNWPQHVRSSGQSSLLPLILQLLTPNSPNFIAWVQVVSFHHLRFISEPKTVKPLHMAAHFDLLFVAEALLASGERPNVKDNLGWTPLHRAAGTSSGPPEEWGGSDTVAKLLLDKGADPNAKGNFDRTPLHRAAEGGRPVVAKMLLEKNADICARDTYGNTPLHTAIYRKSGALVKILLAHGADTRAANKDGKTALHLAVNWEFEPRDPSGHQRIVYPKGIADLKNARGRTPLHLATEMKSEEIVALLLRDHTVRDMPDKAGRTPLHIAVDLRSEELTRLLLKSGARGHPDNCSYDPPLGSAVTAYSYEKDKHERTRLMRVINLLIDYGANAESVRDGGQSSLRSAVLANDDELLAVLLKNCHYLGREGRELVHYASSRPLGREGEESLHRTSSRDDRQAHVVSLLLDKNNEVDVRDSFGNTPLYKAVRERLEGVVKVLLGKGADPNSKCSEGRTPLHMAAYGGSESITKLLFENGADVKATNSYGSTPLHFAMERKSTGNVQLFLDKGADLYAQDSKGFTPADRLVSMYVLERAILKTLLETGLDLNARDNQKRSILHRFNRDHGDGRLKELVAMGADANAADATGQTPLHCAAERGYPRMFEDLIAVGANLAAVDNNRKTLLHCAVLGKSLEILNAVLQHQPDVNAGDNNRKTAVHYAAEQGSQPMLKILAQNGCDMNATDRHGQTALMRAVECNFKPAVEFLVQDIGVDLNIIDNKGKTALQWATILRSPALENIIRGSNSSMAKAG